MAYYTDDQLSIEEEDKHARRGCVLAFFIVPIVCALCFYPIYQFTATGRRVASNVVLFTAQNGIPAPIPYLRGLPNIAQAGCTLDQANPRPANYLTQQQNLEAEYSTVVDWYTYYYAELERNDGDTSPYRSPDEIPGVFGSAKLIYCNR
ncbi:MAG TPA: hypothetical protein PKE64_10765 [Anaerolineae bacterium]|nr:hypothetical protein [Anaerolineae bacterium]HMR64480.1 hypothetical protein [Anaerolineae bacterium]